MSLISIRLPEKLLDEIDHHARVIHIPRAEYIRMAIEAMNKEVSSKQKAERLKKASLKVRKESMQINKEFSRIEHDPED
jgi:metal-responsive CopG/Arc/MetJ family transcriptional regulator